MKGCQDLFIPYKDLNKGKYNFNFTLNECFFQSFDGSEIKSGNVAVAIDFERATSMLILDFSIKGMVEAECDRCLDLCSMPVDYTGRLVVRFSDGEQESDGDVMWISLKEDRLELGQYVLESILLSLPVQKVHGIDTKGNLLCNSDMLSRFCIVSGEEFDSIETSAGSKIPVLAQELKKKL